jgi:PAS domain S-box-containing protein
VSIIRTVDDWLNRSGIWQTIARAVAGIGAGVATAVLHHKLSDVLLPSILIAATIAYLGGGLAGTLATFVSLSLPAIEQHRLPTWNHVEIEFACLAVVWGMALIHQLQRRRSATEALLTEAQLTLDRVPVGTWTADANGSIFSVNNWLLEYTGLERGYFEDKSGTFAERQKRQEQLLPEERDRMIQKWLSVRETATHYEDEFHMRGRDGVFRWFKTTGESLQDAHGKNLRWFGALTNIDAQKEVEAQLRRVEDDLRLIVETIPAFVWVADANGDNYYVNKRLLEYSGAAEGDFKGEGWSTYLHPDDVGPTIVAWNKALESGGPYEFSYRMRRADGVYEWFLVLAQLLRDDVGKPLRWYGIDFNIDAQKRAEEILGVTQARLSRSTQFATVAEFAAAIAHEVAQPLFGANMNAEACVSWLSANPPNVEKARESAELAIEDGRDAAKVIQKVRALFKKTQPSKSSLDLNHAIGEVIRLMRDELARRQTSVEVIGGEKFPSIAADRLQIQQVMWNLIHNAADAMGTKESGRSIQISMRTTLDEVIVSVRDHGTGFVDSDRAFEAFFTTKTNGMGMGLTICKTIIEAHGGTLEIKANPDAGTTVSFSLPLSATPQQQADS